MPTRFLPGGSRQARYLEGLGVPRKRMTIAQMTVDVHAIRRFRAGQGAAARAGLRQRFGISDTAPVVLYLGRLEPHKGVADAIAALERLGDRPDMRLLMIGDGSLRDFVAEKATADPRIVAPGRLSGADVWAACLAADMMVVPSRFEPWGLVVNEGMAAGLPVIASNRVGAVDDLVLEGETGLIVSAEDPAALAAAIARLLDDDALRARISRSADALISSWSIEEEARIVTEVWRTLTTTDRPNAI